MASTISSGFFFYFLCSQRSYFVILSLFRFQKPLLSDYSFSNFLLDHSIWLIPSVTSFLWDWRISIIGLLTSVSEIGRTLYKFLINILFPDNTLSWASVLIFEILLLETDRRKGLRLHTIFYYLRADVTLKNKWQLAYSFSEYKIYFFYAFIYFFTFILHPQQLSFTQMAH